MHVGVYVRFYVIGMIMVFLMGLHTPVNAQLALTSGEGESIELPSYVEHAFPALKNKEVRGRLETSISAKVLRELNRALEVLPKAAHNEYGKRVDIQKINGKTIFVNSEVCKGLKALHIGQGGSPKDDAMLYHLLDAAVELRISPLQNAFAYKVAQRLTRPIISAQSHHTRHCRKYKKEDQENDFHQVVQQVLSSSHAHIQKYEHELSSSLESCMSQEIIEKYVALLMNGVKQEFTIADYIGLNGQGAFKDGVIRLSGLNITGLEGLERVISPQSIKEIDLSHNALHIASLTKVRQRSDGSFVSVDVCEKGLCFAFSRLRCLKKVDLSHNFINHLPDTCFCRSPIESLSLSHNRFHSLSEEFVQSLPHLKEIGLLRNTVVEDKWEQFVQLFPAGTRFV